MRHAVDYANGNSQIRQWAWARIYIKKGLAGIR
jgi:hypothetical protein